jgi:hypothetical protein
LVTFASLIASGQRIGVDDGHQSEDNSEELNSWTVQFFKIRMKDSLLLCLTVLTKNFCWYILVVVARIAGRGMISHEKGRLYIQHIHLCNRYTTKEYYYTILVIAL